MIAGDRNRVKVPYMMIDEIFLDITHHLQGKIGGENAGVLGLVLFQDIGLNGSPHFADGFSPDLFINSGRKNLVAGDAQQK